MAGSEATGQVAVRTVEHRSSIVTRLTMRGHKMFVTCVCGNMDVEMPEGSSVDFPLSKYATHAFEMAIHGRLGMGGGTPPPSIGS